MAVVVIYLLCFPLSEFLVYSLWMSFGCNSLVVVGSRVFVFQPMSLCAGDPNVSEMGAFRYSSTAKYGSRLSRMAFLIRFFAVWMAFSAMPLDCG